MTLNKWIRVFEAMQMAVQHDRNMPEHLPYNMHDGTPEWVFGTACNAAVYELMHTEDDTTETRAERQQWIRVFEAMRRAVLRYSPTSAHQPVGEHDGTPEGVLAAAFGAAIHELSKIESERS